MFTFTETNVQHNTGHIHPAAIIHKQIHQETMANILLYFNHSYRCDIKKRLSK